MQTDDQEPPSTAQEKPSEAAGGSVREVLAELRTFVQQSESNAFLLTREQAFLINREFMINAFILRVINSTEIERLLKAESMLKNAYAIMNDHGYLYAKEIKQFLDASA